MSVRLRVIALCTGLLLSQTLSAAEPPQRLVSAGGALSEWVVALGAQARLVGVDTTSQNPQALRSLPQVGYQRQLSAEGILSLRPDVLAGTEEMGPPAVLEQLRAAGVRVEVLSAQADLAALHDNLQRLGTLLGNTGQAETLFADYRQQLEALKRWTAQARQGQEAPGVLLLVGQGGGKPMIAGTGTAGDWLIAQAGGRNLATHSGYKVFSSEAMAGLSPQVLIVSDRTLRGAQAREALLKENPVLAQSPAAREGRLFDLDPTLLLGGLGPRLPEQLLALAQALYPHASPAQ